MGSVRRGTGGHDAAGEDEEERDLFSDLVERVREAVGITTDSVDADEHAARVAAVAARAKGVT